jgi:adenylate cyclase
MKFETKPRREFRKVIIIAISWTLLTLFSFISQYFFIYDLIELNKLSGIYEFWPDFTGILILGLFGGFVGGYLLVFKMGTRYRQKSFTFGILHSGFLFIVTYLFLAVVGLFIMDLIYFVLQMNFSSAVTKSIDNVLFNMKSPTFFITMCVWAFLISGTQFILQVNDKFGPGVLWKFITGRYYHPREEDKIFMFLDLKSSTPIAEKMGSKKYFELLKDIYRDITEPIINSLGDIYQYVGDEVVVSWSVENGLAKNNCLLCYFRIEQVLEKRKEIYLNKYGIHPSFKAGIHLGEVTVGEIGVIKKDIVFSGDVLNTTSRIQNECNNQKVKILISSQLLQRLQLNGEYEKVPLGEIQLKGKQERVAINTVRRI